MSSATCFECGRPATEFHHIVPESLGGTRTVGLCREHHRAVHSPGQALSLGVLSRLGKRTPQLAWICEVCLETIVDGEGYLDLRSSEMLAYGIDLREAKSKSAAWSSIPLSTYPAQVRWHPLHAKCDPFPDASSTYYVDVKDLRTHEAVLKKTCHLMTKPWIRDTNWNWMMMGGIPAARET